MDGDGMLASSIVVVVVGFRSAVSHEEGLGGIGVGVG